MKKKVAPPALKLPGTKVMLVIFKNRCFYQNMWSGQLYTVCISLISKSPLPKKSGIKVSKALVVSIFVKINAPSIGA